MDKIKDLLLTNKFDINWKGTLKSFADRADECNILLHKIIFFRLFRIDEKERKANRMPYHALLKAWDRFRIQKQNSYPGDLFYYPYEVSVDGQKRYFDDIAASLWLKLLLDPKYELRINDNASLSCYALALKKAFYELAILAAQGAETPLELTFHLYIRLENTYEASKNEWLKLVDEERRRMTNSQNASTTTDRLERIKGHDRYPELDKLASLYMESPQKSTKTRREIDNLISKIVITNSPTTIRRYRRLIFEEYQNDRKAVSDTQK